MNRGTVFYDGFAQRYDQWYSGPTVEAEDGVWRSELRRWAAPLINHGGVVDVGCGTGALIDHLGIDSDRYLGIDAAPQMLRVAEGKHPEARFMMADMDRRINLGRRFDLAVCNFAFNYFSCPPIALWNLSNLLVPGGVLFMTLMRPKQVLMPSCSHRFDFSMVRFYDADYFNRPTLRLLRVRPFGLTGRSGGRWERMLRRAPWLADFEVVVCERI